MAKKKRQTKAPEAAANDPAVASEEANAKLVHTDDLRDQGEASSGPGPVRDGVEEGHSVTTRDDRTDLGVPMLPGSPDEPQGPEDALGPGPKRGDYRDRILTDPHEGGVPQRPRAEEIGDAEGLKGGVETA